jgi:hypothetical protein
MAPSTRQARIVVTDDLVWCPVIGDPHGGNIGRQARQPRAHAGRALGVLTVEPLPERDLDGNLSPAERLPGAHAVVTGQYMESWQYHDLLLQEGFSAAGRLVFVNAFGPVRLRSGKQVPGNYGAAYPVHIRWHTILGGVSGPGPGLSCQDGFPSGYPSWHATIAKALSCGLFRLAGRQYVDGVDAMRLAGQPQYGIRETLWINPATYLPVRLSATLSGRPGPSQQVVTDFRFLPPTRANLAALHAAIRRAPIPITFRLLPARYTVLAGGV